jgi:hypothetical protein
MSRRYSGMGSRYSRRFERDVQMSNEDHLWERWENLATTSVAAAAGIAMVLAINPEIRDYLRKSYAHYSGKARGKSHFALLRIAKRIEEINVKNVSKKITTFANMWLKRTAARS